MFSHQQLKMISAALDLLGYVSDPGPSACPDALVPLPTPEQIYEIKTILLTVPLSQDGGMQ
jgi:hypothetical protein